MPQTAGAHIRLLDPLARHEQQKTAPCGVADDMRGDNIYTFEAGETITIRWEEFVPHPGHYRISFDADGFDDFVDPAAYDDFYTNEAVLLDNIPDMEGTMMYEQEITLPDVECDNCTLQVVQMMTDKPPYGDGNDLYYQCIDIILTAGATTDTEDPTTTSDTDTDSDTDGPTTGSESDTDSDTTTTEGPTGTEGETVVTTEDGTTDETTDAGTMSGGTGDDTTGSEPTGVATDSDTGDSAGGEDEGCSCKVSGTGPAGISLLFASGLLLLRRRR